MINVRLFRLFLPKDNQTLTLVLSGTLLHHRLRSVISRLVRYKGAAYSSQRIREERSFWP